MKITPKVFAKLLRDSTLDPDEEDAILGMLPRLSMKQIQHLGKMLTKDVKRKEKILERAELKTQAVMLRMEVELQREAQNLE